MSPLELKRRCAAASLAVEAANEDRETLLNGLLDVPLCPDCQREAIAALAEAHERYYAALDTWSDLYDRSGEAAKQKRRIAEDEAEIAPQPGEPANVVHVNPGLRRVNRHHH